MANVDNEVVRSAASIAEAGVDFQVTRGVDGRVTLPVPRDEDVPAFTAWYMDLLGLDYEDAGAAS